MKVRTVAVALTVVAAVVVVVAVAAAVDGPRRPPLELPAASAFPVGPCREVADPVLSLGRFTYEHTGSERLPAQAYPFLRQRAEQLAAVRDKVAGTTQPGTAQPGTAQPGTTQPGTAQAETAQTATAQPETGGGLPGGAMPGGEPTPATPSVDPLQQALSPRIDAVLTAIGFLRLRPGKAYDPTLLRDLETARSELQRACVSTRD